MTIRTFLTYTLLFAVSGTLGSQTTTELLKDFAGRIAVAPALEANFLWNETVSGTMVLQGDKFFIRMDEFSIYCNGTEKWYYNEGIDQWETLPHDRNSTEILDNPSAFFSRLDKDFYQSGTPVRKESRQGISLWELTLVPLSIESPFTYVIIQMTVDNLNPFFIRYALSDGSEYSIELLSFKSVPARPSGFFSPDISL